MSQLACSTHPVSNDASRETSRFRHAALELGSTFLKVTLAISIYAAITGGYAHLGAAQAGVDPASQLLPNDVEQSDCAVWFVGSSSMSRWATLQQDMAPWVTHNRSISGGTLVEISRRFANEQTPQRPRAIVFYAGENDLAFGVPAPTVGAEFRTFMQRKTAALGVAFVYAHFSP